VLGPKKLPGAAAQVGRWVGRARAMARQFREQLEQEVASVESALDTNATRATPAKGTSAPPSSQPETIAQRSAGAPVTPDTTVEEPAPGEGWYPPFADPGFGMEPAEAEPAAAAAPEPDVHPAAHPHPAGQPHPEASMVVHPAPEPPSELQAELPFGEAPGAPAGGTHGRSD